MNKPASGAGLPASQLENLKRDFEEAKKRISALENTVNDKSQWNNLVREWLDKDIIISFMSKERMKGKLLSLDRYTLIVQGYYLDPNGPSVRDLHVVHKGAIETISLRK